MKLIGLIGGVTWVSTLDYYRIMNQLVSERLGGLHSARLVVHSIDFHGMAQAQHSYDWQRVGDILIDAARSLEAAGAELFLIGANTLHIVYDRIAAETGLPFVHMVDAVAREARDRGLKTLGLLGTKFTMEEPFYRERLEKSGLEVLTPPKAERDEIHRIIYEELSYDRVLETSKAKADLVVGGLADRGAQAAVLGCTELPLLFRGHDPSASGGAGSPGGPNAAENTTGEMPLLDPLVLHCREAVRQALD